MLSFWSFVLIVVPWDRIIRPELLIFVLVGLIQPGGTRFLAYLSVEKVGVAVTSPIRATTPLFSSLMAIAVLGEQLTPAVGAGTALVVVGIIVLSLREEKSGAWLNILVTLPLLSAFVAGSTQVIRKVGLAQITLPILGAAVTTGTSLVAVAVSLSVSRKWSAVTFDRRSLGWFLPGRLRRDPRRGQHLHVPVPVGRGHRRSAVEPEPAVQPGAVRGIPAGGGGDYGAEGRGRRADRAGGGADYGDKVSSAGEQPAGAGVHAEY